MKLLNKALNVLYLSVDEPENTVEHREHAIDLLASALDELGSQIACDEVEDIIRMLSEDDCDLSSCINELEILCEEV